LARKPPLSLVNHTIRAHRRTSQLEAVVAKKRKFTRMVKVEELRKAHIPPPAIATYCYMADHANNKSGECFPSMKRLAQGLGYSVRQIQRHIKLLVKAGFVEIVRRLRYKGRFSSYLYCLPHIVSTSGHQRRPARSRHINKGIRTKQVPNTPCSPPLSKEQKRYLEDQKRKEGYEFLFGESESLEAEELKRKQREEKDKKRYEGYEDLFGR
jgi:DNA-binding transcriptional MocR family regulator